MTRKLLLVLVGALVLAVPAFADHGPGRHDDSQSSSVRDRSHHDGTDDRKGDDDRQGEDRHGAHPGVVLLRARVAPTVPTDPTVHGVEPGGAPWVIDHGSIVLRASGKLKVEVEGLVIPTAPQNGTNPAPKLAASLFCGSDTPAASTGAVAFSTAGDAEIETRIALPAKCLAPVVLLRVGSAAGPYIAASGFGG